MDISENVRGELQKGKDKLRLVHNVGVKDAHTNKKIKKNCICIKYSSKICLLKSMADNYFTVKQCCKWGFIIFMMVPYDKP